MGKNNHMNPAASIISKVGSPEKVARITGADYTRVCRWRYPEARSGTGGIVPHMAAMKLLRWSKRYGKGLRASHFMQFPSRAEAA
jgi:hypothetical protein